MKSIRIIKNNSCTSGLHCKNNFQWYTVITLLLWVEVHGPRALERPRRRWSDGYWNYIIRTVTYCRRLMPLALSFEALFIVTRSIKGVRLCLLRLDWAPEVTTSREILSYPPTELVDNGYDYFCKSKGKKLVVNVNDIANIKKKEKNFCKTLALWPRV